MMKHPRFRTLARFVDGELERTKKGRTAEHLVRCSRCRDEVASLASLSAAAAAKPEPEAPADALDEILARRASNEGVILPVGATRATGSRPAFRIPVRPTLAAAVAILACLAGLLFWIAPQGAAAGNGELRFTPDRPTAGAEIRVEYRSGSFFPPSDTLRLRARLRTFSDDWYNRGAIQVAVADLVPVGGDLFRGTFRLPADVVYGTFAVEDRESARVDANQRRLWELLVHTPDGRPAFEGLEQRIADHMGRNWEVARETAYWMTRVYPERVESWSQQAYFQAQSLGETAYEDLRPGHRDRYLAFHDSLSREGTLSAEQIEAMQMYWWGAGGNYDELDSELWKYWDERLTSEYPERPSVLFGLANEHGRELRDDPDAHMAAVEPLWERLAAAPPSRERTSIMGGFINNTLNRAGDAEDPSWFLRWIERYRRFDQAVPEGMAYLVGRILDRDDLRDDGIRLLREERRRLDAELDGFRPLTVSRDRQRVLNEESAARLLRTMSEGFLAAGDTLAALDSLDFATQKAWSPDTDRLLGEIRLATGDTLGAIRHYAAVAADPGTPASFADSVLSLVGTGVALEQWNVASEQARDRLARQVMAHADPRPIRGPLRLRDASGAESTLAQLADGKPVAVIMFSRHCPWAVQALPEIERVSDWVGSRGGRVVLVSEDEPDAELDELMAENEVELMAMHDFKRDATRALSNFGTPHHYIVGGDGTLIFEGAGRDEISRIPLQVEALLRTDGSTPADSTSGG